MTDAAFSLAVRAIGYCEKCGATDNLTCSHFHGRRKRSVRFDRENCACLCFTCHRWWQEHRNEYEAWMVERLGQNRFDALTLRANRRTE